MASSKVMSRLSCRLQSLSTCLKQKPKSSDSTSFLKSNSQSSAKRIPRISRSPVELSCVDTMLPLHTAIASARLRSSLSIDSHSCCLVPQGISLPL